MIPLIAPKAFDDFSPEEYRTYIESLYHKPEKKRVSRVKPFVARRTKLGRLSLKVNRRPAWLSQDEMNLISSRTGIPLSEIFLKMQEKGVMVSSAEEQEQIKKDIADIPW